MTLPSFIRRVLGKGQFPQLVGQELPGPVPKGNSQGADSPALRAKALGRVAKPKTQPDKEIT